MRRGVLVALMMSAVISGSADAQQITSPITLPVNDFEGAVGLLYGQTPHPAAVQHSEPALAPSPRAQCDASSHPLEGMQGRVPAAAIDSPQAEDGWTCNLSVVSNFADAPGGFRV